MPIIDTPPKIAKKKKAPQKRIITKIAPISAQITKAKKEVEALSKANIDNERNTLAMLKSVYEIRIIAEKHAGGTRFLEEMYKEAGIRRTKRTPNDYTPLLKLIAGNLPKETLSRSGAVLAYAQQNRIASEDLYQFIDNRNGIVQCVKEYRSFLQPERQQKLAEKTDEHLNRLRDEARPFDSAKLSNNTLSGLQSILIEVKNGTALMLGWRSEKTFGRYQSFSEIEEPNFN